MHFSAKRFAGLKGLPVAVISLLLSGGVALGAGPTASEPYTLTLFKGVPPTGATQPDDLAISTDGADLWISYGNGACTFGPSAIGTTNCPTGTPADSNLVEYDISTGTVLQNLSIPGHLDGLKINPKTGDIWTTQNEDGNPTLAVVNHKTGKFKQVKVDETLLTGGLDDLVIAGKDSKDVFITASSQADATKPVIVQIQGSPKKTGTALTAFLTGSPTSVWNVVTNTAETADVIGDPDSMTIDPAGELVLDNRSDKSLYIARASGATNPVLRVPLTIESTPVEVNDTIFVTSSSGTVFITDTKANAIYLLTKPFFAANEVYTAANVVGDVGVVDLNTGDVVPVATGFSGVHGLAFAPATVTVAP